MMTPLQMALVGLGAYWLYQAGYENGRKYGRLEALLAAAEKS